jgi:hypothetical protein
MTQYPRKIGCAPQQRHHPQDPTHRHPTVAARPRSGGPQPNVDGEAQVPRMPAARSPWDDGGVGCCEERAGAHAALHPLPGVRRIRSNTITPLPNRHPTVAAQPRSGGPQPNVDGEAQAPRMPAARSPWDDGVEACFEERAGARFALHPLPGVRRVRSNTITPIPHRHPTVAAQPRSGGPRPTCKRGSAGPPDARFAATVG